VLLKEMHAVQHVDVSCSHLVMFVIAALGTMLIVERNDCFCVRKCSVLLWHL